MADLDHEYCVRYYDSFIDEGKLNIVMEYCDRGDLQRLLKNQGNKKLKEDVIWRLFIQMALGLRYLHTKRILHRDIKSANVFLCKVCANNAAVDAALAACRALTLAGATAFRATA